MAATIIDSLVVELGLDPSKFSSGQQAAMQVLRHLQEASEKGAKQVESQTRNATGNLANLRREALSVAGVFLGGMGVKEFIGYVSTLDASTGRVAKTLDMSTRELGAWQGAVKQVGGSVESANQSLTGLSGELQRFAITGQSGVLGVLNQFGVALFDRNQKLKTSGQIMLELAEKIKGREPRQATAMLSMLGINQDMINLLLLGRDTVEKYLEAGRKAGTATEESSAAAQKWEKELSLLKDAGTNAGRALMEYLYPALTKIATALRELIQLSPATAGVFAVIGGAIGIAGLKRGAQKLAPRIFGATAPSTGGSRVLGALGPYGAAAAAAYGVLAPTEAGAGSANQQWWKPLEGPAGATPTTGGGGSGAFLSDSHREAFIRKTASEMGIDPNIAVKVWDSEGRRGYVGDKGSSFGPFQLHYGGMAPGGNSGPGLGDEFTRRTGLHAQNPATEREQIVFALSEARKGGWGPWHGWKGMPYAGISRPGAPGAAASASMPGAGSTTTVTTSIGAINLNGTQVHDAEDAAREIGPALDRQIKAGSANQGGF